jgi:hypothetical protein
MEPGMTGSILRPPVYGQSSAVMMREHPISTSVATSTVPVVREVVDAATLTAPLQQQAQELQVKIPEIPRRTSVTESTHSAPLPVDVQEPVQARRMLRSTKTA